MRLRLVSWNVHKCVGGLDRRYRPERVIEVLRHHEPDLVLLQECANGSGKRAWDRQVDLLAEGVGLGHHSWFVNHRFRAGGEYGNAVLARWPIDSTENVDLTVAGRKVRSALHARLRIRDVDGHARTVHVFNMHLGLREDTRRRQLQTFLASHPFAGLHTDTPIVVGGDLNDVWGTLGPQTFAPAGFRAMPQRLRTFPAWAPLQALDAVYLRGTVEFERVARSRMRLARTASDHLPLVAELRLLGPAHVTAHPTAAPAPATASALARAPERR
ncbi:MAG: endonuclease/exonuclease/phosphatase family protein [Planctomycetes bacterium]|nr:endonuclease/exonuclease/phosphatase family protein [Planctomycetota bacterium]